MSGKKIILIAFILVIIIIIMTILANNWRNKQYINKFTVKGNFTLNEEDILSFAGLKKDTTVNLEELNMVFIRDRVAKHPEIKKVTVSKEPPSELIIDIVEKKPIAVLIENNELKLIDEESEIFSFNDFGKAYDLPVINGLRMNNQANYKSEITLAVNFLKLIYNKGKSVQSLVSEINMNDSTKIIVHTNDKPVAFYFPRPDKYNNFAKCYNEKIGLFNKFYENEVAVNSNPYEYVDLRFSNQIIVKLNLLQ